MIRFYTVLLLAVSPALYAQNTFQVSDYANFAKYRDENNTLVSAKDPKNRVVFIGNSITESWPQMRPKFFESKGYIGRGISGQVTHQMLLRFRRDVIELKPGVVVILAGINDIAQNSGYVAIEEIADNIKSMADLADHHGIKVVICSVLPAVDFPWNPGLTPAPKVMDLNNQIRNYADKKGFVYVDFHSAMMDDYGGLKVPEFTSEDDLVHPNSRGYEVMESILQPVLNKELRK